MSYSSDEEEHIQVTETQPLTSTPKKKGHERSNEPYWTTRKIFVVVTFCFANFSVGAYYSILGPFYPQEAAKKGMSQLLTGVVFSCFEAVIIIMAPIYGTFLTKIGAKFLYCAGLLVAGSSAVLFGILEYCPGGTPFIVMSFVVRTVEGIATSGFITASMAILANTFPDKVASMIGNLELFTGLGLMAGPPLGGVLYTLGGFKLPFLTIGGLNVIIAVISIWILPSQHAVRDQQGSMLGLLRIPIVLIMGLTIAAGTSAIGFLDVGLALWLKEQFNFSPIVVGVLFLVGPGMYAVMSPIWGLLADKIPRYSLLIILVGYGIASAGFMFLGPAPFIPVASNHLWLVIISLLGFGMGVGTLVASFQILSNAALEAGLPENLDTFGLVSGLFNIYFSCGAFAGPLIAGSLLDTYGFQWASFAFSCLSFMCVVLISSYLILKRPCLVNPADLASEKRLDAENQGETEVITAPGLNSVSEASETYGHQNNRPNSYGSTYGNHT